jgi:K+-sensing histidine kinase KdpD
MKDVSDESYFIFPLTNKNNEIIALFSIWKKPFKEQFSKNELMIFEDLKIFLEWHIKYIEIHKKIHELSVNLDKQVDKQTIEYNQLINKQKEFISYVSHEVKWPIASSIFQIDSIIEEVIDDELNKKWLLKELHILNDLLLKTWELVNKLFSIQQFELNSTSLFKERVHLTNLLKHEVWLFQKVHTGITFITDFDSSIKYVELDKVQFRQVIDNLLNNAVKVIDPDEWEISLSCKQKDKEIIIEIEDNWKGFTNLDIKKIFDKYSTWKWSSVWLGMWLYLCKTIVELHWGNIQAAFWKKLWWAKIIIKIPII